MIERIQRDIGAHTRPIGEAAAQISNFSTGGSSVRDAWTAGLRVALIMFARILVANRGEIAVRVIRAIHALGARAVAVYSDSDRTALHVQCADEAYRIGPAPASDSYLNIEAILDAATRSRVDAIHPGYGFLAENAGFARAVTEAGITFIGPPADVIALLGDKIAAKRLMIEHGIPVLPGYSGRDQGEQAMLARAGEIGYPIMLKAAAGGGGRGMRVVTAARDLPGALEAAGREAVAAFGDGTVFLEKLLIAPHHIEVQVLADTYGRVISLGERECSIQRRHQKVIEESPSPAISPDLRAAMSDAAVRAARAAGYVSAGTVEFLFADERYYFLEMNTRIQVEHPVTEMVTGIDLVKAQIEIAAGLPLEIDQADVELHGHAIECRLYAEDPDNDFLPQSGFLSEFAVAPSPKPESRPTAPACAVRNDVGVFPGSEITPYYDPLLAKVTAHAADRSLTIACMREALDQTVVGGIKTNLDFLRWVVASEPFHQADTTTAFVERYWRPLDASRRAPAESPVAIPLGAAAYDLTGVEAWSSSLKRGRSPVTSGPVSPWLSRPGWRVGSQRIRLAYDIEGRRHEIEAAAAGIRSWRIDLDGESYDDVRLDPVDGERAILRVGPNVYRLRFASFDAAELRIQSDEAGEQWYCVRRSASLPSPLARKAEGSDAGAPAQGTVETLGAPMPGTIVKIYVEEGARVQGHQPLVVMEAMKMEHVLEAPHAGIVKRILRAVGDLVPAGTAVVEVESE